MNKKKKSTNTSPYPDEVIDRLARAFYPAILACWNSEEGQREFAAWQAEQAHHANNEKQEVPAGELPVVHIAIVCGFWQGASGRTHPVFVSSWLGVHQNASPQLLIGFFRHRLAPLVRGVFAGHFHCQMREPAIGCSTVPVLDLRGNVHHIARMQLQRRFAPFLIVAPACHADKDLSATLCGMVDVPVVPAARLKGDVVNANLCGGQRVPDSFFR